MPSIGVFLAQLEDAYQSAIWRGIEARAGVLGLGVTAFVGPGPAAFAIAGSPAFDGLIVLTTTIGALPDLPSLRALPRVSLGQKVSGVPSVTVDGTPGLWDLVRHLTRHHGRRRFALITGPGGHAESLDREQAIRQALAAEGLDLDPGLVVRGTFYEESGAEAVGRLLARGRDFDVVMALNDRMALGALEALAQAGIRVPEEVSVTGFDDIEQGRHVTPPLTTIDQPLEAMGTLAVDMISAILAGGRPPDRVLSCGPVRRWSCGCPPGTGATASAPPADQGSAETELLAAQLAQDDGPGFLTGLARALGAAPDGVTEALAFVDHLEDRAFPEGGGRHPLVDAGRRLAAEVQVRRQGARRHRLEARFASVRDLSARIAGAFGREALLGVLRDGWASVGVAQGFLVLFEGPPEAAGVPGTSRLVLPEDPGTFPTRDLLPSRWNRPWKSGRWIVQPLVYQDHPLGYLLLEGTAEDPAVYGALGAQVASTLQGTLLTEALRSHEKSLEDLVAHRTADLKREVAHRQRLERQVQQISDQTMRRIGQDLHDDLCQHLAGIAMLAQVVRRTLPAEASGASGALDRIGNLLQDSIVRARQIARGLYPPGLEERGLADAVEELVAVSRQTSPVVLLYEAEGDCRGGDPERRLQMFRIVQESLSNALKHSGTDIVRVRLVRDPDQGLTATVTDFGTGLGPRPGTGIPAQAQGLGLGIMRHRAEAAGLELRFEDLAPGLRVTCRQPPEGVLHG